MHHRGKIHYGVKSFAAISDLGEDASESIPIKEDNQVDLTVPEQVVKNSMRISMEPRTARLMISRFERPQMSQRYQTGQRKSKKKENTHCCQKNKSIFQAGIVANVM